MNWTRPSCFRREYLLEENGREIARVTFDAMRSSARVIAGDESWTIRRSGFWKPRVTVHRDGVPVAAARAFWNGRYDLEAPEGGAFRWSCLSVWKSRYGWTRFDGTPLMTYRPASAFSSTYAIEREPDLPDTSVLLLAILGGYLLALTQEELMAATIAASG